MTKNPSIDAKTGGITKVSEVKGLVLVGIEDPRSAFPKIKGMAASADWKVREVAATVLVELSKKKPEEVVREAVKWADDPDPNVRRASSEGLREIARKNPNAVLPILNKLKTDSNLYVKKSVANVLRNAGRYHPDFVLGLCKTWAALKNPDTGWIIKDGLRKLNESKPKEVGAIIGSLGKKHG